MWAGDDTKVHRGSPGVWGTCTFHNYSARSPNRAITDRAHDWVVVGALLPQAGQPALFLPPTGLSYFRKTQMPTPQKGPPVVFRTKCELLVDLGRRHAKACKGKHLLVFDGGFALRSVVRRMVESDEPGQPRIESLIRLRHDARLCAPPSGVRRPGQRGPLPKYGRRLSPPRQGGRWPGS